jgi:hypothetical protein
MKVTIYDRNPGGGGLWQGFLKTSWVVGCWLQKAVGAIDDYYGATTWEEARAWLASKQTPINEIQYWGHGSPGTVWMTEKPISVAEWISLKPLLAPDAVLWFRVCDAFQGTWGQHFSKILADNLNCTVAGHTRIVGLWQGGLYTRKPNTEPSWSVTEGGEPSWLREDFKFWNKHTIFCLTSSIPKCW